MGWEMNAINGHTSKLHKYTVLDTVLKLENKKVKRKNTWLLKRFNSMFRTALHCFSTCHGLNPGSSYRGLINTEMI